LEIEVTSALPMLSVDLNGPYSAGERVEVTVSADQGGGAIPVLSVAGAPEGAEFVDHGDGSGQLTWPSASAGSHQFTFTAADAERPELNAAVTVELKVAASAGGGGAGPLLLAPLGLYLWRRRGGRAASSSRPAATP
jgi:hypothetical protein